MFQQLPRFTGHCSWMVIKASPILQWLPAQRLGFQKLSLHPPSFSQGFIDRCRHFSAVRCVFSFNWVLASCHETHSSTPVLPFHLWFSLHFYSWALLSSILCWADGGLATLGLVWARLLRKPLDYDSGPDFHIWSRAWFHAREILQCPEDVLFFFFF